MSRLFALLLCILAMMTSTEARVLLYEWEVKYELKSLDAYKEKVITINGQSPGPTIQAHQGDTINIKVTNGLVTENLAMDWGGIRQIGTPPCDGTKGVTRCLILPGKTFTYRLVVDRLGTYSYQSRYPMQREAGLRGSIRVDP